MILKTQSDRPVVDAPVTILRPSKGWPTLNLQELWEYHELLYFLVWRQLKVRYKQTVLGAAWAVIQPFFAMIVFSVFFGRLAGMPSDGAPYPIFVYAALVPWTYFANALTLASNSLVEHEKMLTKVYFPRLMLPLAAVLAGLLDLAIAFLVLLGLAIHYGVAFSPSLSAAPLFALLASGIAVGAGLWLSALNVQYRDVRYITPFLVQIWLFATPVAYPSSLVPERWRALYGLNPMAGVVEGFRWAVLGKGRPPGMLLLASILMVVVILTSGLYYFRRTEKTFADVV
jgi:homopolymeric O-antigen transport system permease protein